MKHSKVFLTSLPVFLIFFLAACGDIRPQLTEELDEETAGELSSFALDSQERLAAMMPGSAGMPSLASSSSRLPKQVASLLPQRGLSALSTEDECITFTGDFTDADADEIPVDATFTFDCAYSEEGSDFTVTGRAHFQDANDADALSGYTTEFKDFTMGETKDGQKSTLELDQKFVLTIKNNENLYIIENDLVLTATTPKEKLSYSELATLDYRPDAIADPFVAGTFALNNVTVWQSGEDVYKLTGVAPALHYSSSCESSFDDGSVSYKDNLGNSLELIFNACNNVTVIYNGTPLAGEK
jgi:hypothetical protein